MSRRSNTWVASRFEPFKDDPKLELKEDEVRGALHFLNPTHAKFDYIGHDDDHHVSAPTAQTPGTARSQLAKNIQYRWRSRDNRKGRHTILVDPTVDPAEAKFLVPEFTNSFRAVMKGIGKMFWYFPVWNVSYLTAQCFFWGSVIFVANGLFYWLPLLAPPTAFDDESKLAGGITAFVGCVFFQFGVVFLMLEAVNAGRVSCFGFALHEAMSHEDSDDGLTSAGKIRVVPSHHHCVHHHSNTKSLLSTNHRVVSPETGEVQPASNNVKPISAASLDDDSPAKIGEHAKGWVWFPSWHELTTHYFHEIGFLSALIYFLAATVFWMVGFASLPNVEQSMSDGVFYGVFWMPDLLGSLGFIIGSYLIMLETQPNWYTPSLGVIGWHIGLWNLIGSIGFGLSAAFGTADFAIGSESWLLWQSDCHTTWGSFAFAVASALQWYECINKDVVEKMKS